MANIFESNVPEWLRELAKPIDSAKTGQFLGLLASAATKSASDGTPFTQAYGEARMNLADPLWRDKAEAVQTRTALQNEMLRTKIQASSEVSKWQAEAMKRSDWYDHPYLGPNPDAQRIISSMQTQGRQSTAAKTATQAATLAAKEAADRAHDFTEGMLSLPPEEQTEILEMNKPNQPPNSKQFFELGQKLRRRGIRPPWEKPVGAQDTLEKLYEGKRRAEALGDTEAIEDYEAKIELNKEGAQTTIREERLYALADKFESKGDIRNAEAMRRVARHEFNDSDKTALRTLRTALLRQINKLKAEIAGLSTSPSGNKSTIAKKQAELTENMRSLNALTLPEIDATQPKTAPAQPQATPTTPATPSQGISPSDFENWIKQNR